LLLDAALSNGIELPHDCRAGHCGTCCVRLVSGEVRGGEGSEPGIVHACQCRIAGDADFEMDQASRVRTVEGVLSSLHPLSPEVMEVGIRTNRALPHLAGQYAQVSFSGYPSRPFSITHPLHGNPNGCSVWFHVRRMKDGRVTSSLGKRIKQGHRVMLTGPYGSAHFRPNLNGPLILVATTPALRRSGRRRRGAAENPKRRMMIIAGGRTIESLYMGPALARLTSFPNVLVMPVCSTPQTLTPKVKVGRPTDYLPRLLPTDVLYACGAPAMVDSIKSLRHTARLLCGSVPARTTDDTEESVLTRAMGWLVACQPANGPARSIAPQPGGNSRWWLAGKQVRSHYRLSAHAFGRQVPALAPFGRRALSLRLLMTLPQAGPLRPIRPGSPVRMPVPNVTSRRRRPGRARVISRPSVKCRANLRQKKSRKEWGCGASSRRACA
jgi:3-phenylpropionate/trans-cinnamate dioxygenase ferredoxin reductase subunit